MDSYDGPAVMEQGGDEVRVRCMFRSSVDSPSGLKSWRGTFSLSETVFTLGAGEASMRLPTGEVGTVIMNRVNHGPDGTTGTFVGTGASPRKPTGEDEATT